ncbi:serine/threonine protein kinase [Metabacillus rhizolycopersici]|uniref:Protein kinase family protein n=1 Tax=Metabacillus rhizolycopersici TaxID=2875709 RepID=A0ABS7ULZ0_9BACI|nr:protein kinase family protein [Metabacillus rhizolycopersici]MBZ5749224.1 protein kinase family protein [Metabacillus rhizolycopersici]
MKGLYSKLIEIGERPLKSTDIVGGKYFVEGLLGKGSYGFTYLVKDQSNQIFVLKQLRKYKMLMESGRQAFKREANILKSLSHRAFPSFIEQFEENEKQFIVMEYKCGKTFEDLIFQDNISFSETEAFKELYHILLLVKHIHENGYVHRDLRIPNILKDVDDYYIIDFGLTRKLNDQNSIEEETVMHMEKRLFREVATKSDFYALGHFLLFLLYSRYEPVSKKKRSWEEELSISIHAKKVIRKMLQIDEPYKEVQLLLDDVKKWL